MKRNAAGIPFHNLIPGIGLGDFKFGMTRDAVRSLAKKPSQEIECDADGDAIFIYGEDQLYLYFDREEDLRFTSLEVYDTRDLLLDGVNIFSMKYRRIENYLVSLGYNIKK